jgi:phosphoribosylformimino-5-aminoimidazole carboxamide ribotide isomerase
MDLYARINLLDGQAVRLPKGNVREAVVLDDDPVARAQGWIAQGADGLHVVDLDAAAFGEYDNRTVVREIINAVDVPVQVAGGIRSPGEVEKVLGFGASRVVLGTAAIEDQVMVWDLCRDNPGCIVVSLDVRHDEEIAIRGWLVDSGVFLEQALLDLSSAGVAAFLIGEAGRDALVSPSDYGILRRALALADEPVTAAGGATDIDDLRSLAALEESGKRLAGVIVGREITEGRFTIKEAQEVLGD